MKASEDTSIVLEAPEKTGLERAREERLARLRDLEDTILIRAANVVDATMAWAEVEAHTADPPPQWVEMYGEEGARQRLNVARAGWKPQAEAPVGQKYAVNVLVGIAKARGQGKQSVNRQLNVQICLPAPTSKEHPDEGETYEVIDVDP